MLRNGKISNAPTSPTIEPNAPRFRFATALGITILLGLALLICQTDSPRTLGQAPLPVVFMGPSDSMKGEPTTKAVAHLAAKARPAAPSVVKFTPGEKLRTAPGDRRRVLLADGTVLYVNENSEVRYPLPRKLELVRGEIFVEVCPKESGFKHAFTVVANGRTLSALGTRFAVRADAKGPGVLVAQGAVQATGFDTPLTAGQEIRPGSTRIEAAPRSTHALEWTRDLMSAAALALVPASDKGGGALIALDPSGQEVRLTLRKFQIDVHIEDGFARTTIDQTYFNNDHWRSEGTFYFPLPPDASLSRLAMYAEDGKSCVLNEGGMAERQRARNVYETIRHQQRDPALLEWVDGSTFKMRVFPLEGRKEKRIILSYTQRLPALYGIQRYRFPAGHSMELVRDWSFFARVKHGADLRVASPSHPTMKSETKGGDLLLSAADHAVKPNKDVVLEILPAAAQEDAPHFRTSVHENHEYLMLRYRPELKAELRAQRRDWVILFESAANRDPLLARAQIEIVRHLLESAEADDTFTLLTANTRTKLFDKTPRPAVGKQIDEAIAWLEASHLVGALDLEKAFDAARPLIAAGKNPHLVHIGAGFPALGERDATKLVDKIPAGVTYVGIGVGKRWNRAFMKQAAEKTAGFFAQLNPDEPLNWGTFDVLATLSTPRLMDVRVADPEGKAVFLTETLALSQGEEICAFTRRVAVKGEKLPARVVVTGTLDGKPFRRVMPVEKTQAGADYLPRTWAKLEIDRLLADGAAKNQEAITKLSLAMYVMSPFTSLLVLETEEDYKTFKVDRGRKDHWALYPCPDRSPIVYEPDPAWAAWQAADVKDGRKPAEAVVASLLRVKRWERSFPGYNFNLPHTGLSGPLDGRGSFIVDEAILLRPKGLSRGIVDMVGSIDGRADFGKGGKLRIYPVGALVIPVDPRLGQQDFSQDATLFSFLPPSLALSARSPANDSSASRRDKIGFAHEWTKDYFGWRGKSVLFEEQTYHRARHELSPPTVMSLPIRTGRTFIVGKDISPERVLRRSFKEIVMDAEGFDRIAERNIAEHTNFDFSPEDSKSPVALQGRLRLALEMSKHVTASNTADDLLFYGPRHEKNGSLFSNLIRYAPGLHTSDADVRAALDDEAIVTKPPFKGSIDEGARRLIEQARSADWETITLAGDAVTPPFQVTYNGRGAFHLDRLLSCGLREEIACDGDRLWHVYREIGLAGRRTFSRHHFGAIGDLVPWLVPAAEDLAHTGDVKLIAENIVALIPPPQPKKQADKSAKPATIPAPYQLHFVFAKGRLRERRLVESATGATLATLTYAADGACRVVDRFGNEIYEVNLARTAAVAPKLQPDVNELLVFRFPLRTASYLNNLIREATKQKDGFSTVHAKTSKALAEDLIIAYCLGGSGYRAVDPFGERFHNQGDRRLGFYVLLNASGYDYSTKKPREWSNGAKSFLDELADHPGHPLALYLNHNRTQSSDAAPVAFVGTLPGDRAGLLNRLAQCRDLVTLWHKDKAGTPGEKAFEKNCARTLDFLRTCPEDAWAWEVLHAVRESKLMERGPRPETLAFHFEIAKSQRTLTSWAGREYASRYEYAANLFRGGKKEEARKQFLALHEDALREGMIPPIEGTLRDAVRGAAKTPSPRPLPRSTGGEGEDGFVALQRETHRRVLAERRPRAAVLLAWQTYQMGEHALADAFLDKAVESVKLEDRNLVRLAGLEYLWHTDRKAKADEWMGTILDDSLLGKQAFVWRLASKIADNRKNEKKRLHALETAIDIEFRDLPEIIDLQAVRGDYQSLLSTYGAMLDAHALASTAPPSDLAGKIVRAADRWRQLDPDKVEVPRRAAALLRKLGQDDLAWDYETTPIGLKPGESEPWLELASHWIEAGDSAKADLSFVEAFKTEPTNADILRQRAEHLQSIGRTNEARELYRQIAEGDWQPRFQDLRERAKGLR